MAERVPPDIAEIHRLMSQAAAAFSRGDLQQAAQGAARALELMPDMPDALHLLGLCFLRGGDAGRATLLLRHAALIKPADVQLLHNLGVASKDAGDIAGALGAFTRAVMQDPGQVESRFNLGVISEEAGDTSGAELAYRETLMRSPHHPGAAAYLAAILEQRSELDEAAHWNEIALAQASADPVSDLTAAQLELRAGAAEQAAARLEALLRRDGLSSRNRGLAATRLGAAYDRLRRPQLAWPQFLAAKQALAEARETQEEGVYGFAAASRMHRHMDALLQPGPVAEGPPPVFLVGFPRSGTTLLDRILSAHPSLQVLEEKDTLQDVLQATVLDDVGMQAFLSADAGDLAAWRRAYWQRVAEYLPERRADAVFVDKLPLNSVFMPLMHRLFPKARFIFALRDPRDVVLSCFMQGFDLNEAMRHFLSLEETARYYAAVMQVGADSTERLGARVHTVRYEEVVADTEGEARRLLQFLDLPWDPAVLEFSARTRGKRINTPSYHQVAEPIYTRAKGRWTGYEAELAPVLPVLAPFVSRFGY
ncbi:MAG TPA: sulfotransferase [Gammaproteobacteria bacterium]|nr:sulfotransferase [Gammaproteobacteria bacterium]